MRQLDGIIDSMDMILSKLRKIVKDREAWIWGFSSIQFTHSVVSNSL